MAKGPKSRDTGWCLKPFQGIRRARVRYARVILDRSELISLHRTEDDRGTRQVLLVNSVPEYVYVLRLGSFAARFGPLLCKFWDE